MSTLEASELYLECARNFAWASFYVVAGLFSLCGAGHVARIIYDDCRG